MLETTRAKIESTLGSVADAAKAVAEQTKRLTNDNAQANISIVKALGETAKDLTESMMVCSDMLETWQPDDDGDEEPPTE